MENHNVTAQTQWKKYSLNNSQGQETHCIQRNKSNDSKNNRRFLNASDKIVVQLLQSSKTKCYYTNFLLLLQQITTNAMNLNNMNFYLKFLDIGNLKSVHGLKSRYLHVCIPSGSSRGESIPLPFPASRPPAFLNSHLVLHIQTLYIVSSLLSICFCSYIFCLSSEHPWLH